MSENNLVYINYCSFYQVRKVDVIGATFIDQRIFGSQESKISKEEN